jgi:hypothetical protein
MVPQRDEKKRAVVVVAMLIASMPVIVMGLSLVFNLGKHFELTTLDLIWMLICIVSGILVLIPFKLSWLVSLGMLSFVILINLTQLFLNWQEPGSPRFIYEFIFSVMSVLTVLLLVSYYRFPFLDRRDTLFFGIADRHEVKMRAVVNEQVIGEVISASVSGVLFKTEGELKYDQKNKQVRLTIQDLNLTSVPVEIVGTKGDAVRLKFESLSFASANQIKKSLGKFPKEDG